MSEQDSHLSQGPALKNLAPVRQHHRLAADEKGVDGMKNPNGAEVASTKNMVPNNQGKTY